MNPNYRYRPTYRKEVPSKRRKKKAIHEEEVEEEDRKCEVVARVLLEGREVDADELEREVEEQKLKDQLEGRQRTGRSRSRSRSNSKLSDGMRNNHNDNLHTDAQSFFLGMGGRPSSAPPQGADPFEGNSNVPVVNNHFNGVSSRGKRSRTIGTSGPDFIMGEYSSLAQQPNLQTQVSHQRYMSESVGNTLPPSLRNASNLQHLFSNESSTASSEPAHSAAGYTQFPAVSQSPFLSTFSGFKGGNGDVSLLSPSFSRKFSLGRWEVPQHHSTGGSFGSPLQGNAHPFTGQQGSEASGFATSALQQNPTANAGTVSSAASSLGSHEQNNYSAVAHPPSDQAFDPAAVPPGYNCVPTYVYLSKEDAQNPQVCQSALL